MVDAFHSRRDLVVGLLKKSQVKINVEGAFTYFQTFLLSLENIKGTEIKCHGLSMYLLAKANVTTVTGDAFVT
jgi:aspartate aminotransferase